jgi:hypothetical protein
MVGWYVFDLFTINRPAWEFKKGGYLKWEHDSNSFTLLLNGKDTLPVKIDSVDWEGLDFCLIFTDTITVLLPYKMRTNTIPIVELGNLNQPTLDTINWKNLSPSTSTPIFITLQDLLDYEKECYNDSTQMIRGDTIFANIEFNKPGELDYMKVIPIYEHNKKPTLEGFIQYMKRKYGIK